MIKVWYLVEVKDELLEQYFNEGDWVGFVKKYGFFDQVFIYFDWVFIYIYQEFVLVVGKFLVLIFFYGYFFQVMGYYILLEEFVSYGYVVFNINYVYESVGMEYLDGEIIFYGVEYECEKYDEVMIGMVWEVMEKYGKGSICEEKYVVVYDLFCEYYFVEVNECWIKDVGWVLDQFLGWQ